jgi:uncharacterized protein
VDFEWDEAKDRSNHARHSISFSEAIAIFADPKMVVLDASRERDQESRSKAIGMIEGRIFVVVFTERKSATRVISARRANRVEERMYGNRQGKA